VDLKKLNKMDLNNFDDFLLMLEERQGDYLNSIDDNAINEIDRRINKFQDDRNFL